MHYLKTWKLLFLSLFLILVIQCGNLTALEMPAQFDLRDFNGENYVTSVKSQSGGTCWTHGAMAAIEGNLLMTDTWSSAGESGEPNMAEYHLDWWNGFNQNNNDDTDPPTGGGLIVHEGGDYRVTSAYLSRGEGAVRDIDGQSFGSPPLRSDTTYHYFYIPHIEWYVVETDLSNIDLIKQKVMDYGVMGTCLCYDGSFLDGGYNHYQPPADLTDPNHAVAIIGWDDNRITQAPQPGAWLIKNSWGAGWGYDGYFWISYYDKHAGRQPEMGAISFYGVEPNQYDWFYYHDYHGWRNTKTDCGEAFNAFIAEGYEYGLEKITAVSFFTAADSVDYTVSIYDSFESGALLDVIATKAGFIEHTGFHTIILDNALEISNGDDFYVYLSLSKGGQPYDETSDVPVLLGAKYRTIVESSAEPGESYYYDGSEWQDLNSFESSANFCIKALSEFEEYLSIGLPDGIPEYIDPGQSTIINVEIIDVAQTYLDGSAQLYYRFDGGQYLTAPLTPVSGDIYAATLPGASCTDIPEYYFIAEGENRNAVSCPKDAPASVFTSLVGEKEFILNDNCETDIGWTTDYYGATSGYWQRGIPVNDDGWDYDPATDGDGSGQCWLTLNEAGNTDLDNGSVTLISPVFDMSQGGNISYYYYLYLTNTDNYVDRLQVEIDNGTYNWIEIESHETDGGLNWHYHIIDQDYLESAGITFGSTMQVRFTAYDSDPQSIVEAGIDGFSISFNNCIEAYMCGDADGSSTINILDITYLINYLYKDGPAPDPIEPGDSNGDGGINILDVTHTINYLYKDGPPPICP